MKRQIFQVKVSTCRVFAYNSVTSMLICKLAGEINVTVFVQQKPFRKVNIHSDWPEIHRI